MLRDLLKQGPSYKNRPQGCLLYGSNLETSSKYLRFLWQENVLKFAFPLTSIAALRVFTE